MSTEATTTEGAGPVDANAAQMFADANFGDKDALAQTFAEEFGITEDKPADPPASGKQDAKGEKAEADPAAKAKPDEEDPDIKTIREINARTRARREARDKARQAAEARAKAAAPAAAQAAPAAAAPEKPATPAPAADVAKAVADVLAEIQKLASDGEKPAAEATPKDERAAAILALQGKLEELTKNATVNADLQKKLDDATGRLAAIEKHAQSRETNARYIIDQVRPILAELPLLSAHRPTLKEPRTAIEMIEAAAGRYVEKFKAVPDMRSLARRIEKKLASTNDDGSEKKPAENPPKPKSKTVSAELSSPPAARSGPDKRTAKEVSNDLFAAFGLPPDE